jgi:glycerol-3-phosphate dehydrogenase (NAD(P)+)
MSATVAVLGGGAWGSALAVHLAARSHARPRVFLYLRSAKRARDCAAQRENARYLPGIALPASITVTAELADLRDAEVLIVATPVAGLVPLATELVAHQLTAPLALACKGFVVDPGAPGGYVLAHQALAAQGFKSIGGISGPSFASEVARGLPTALAVAATDPAMAGTLAALLRSDSLRCYASDDLAGIEVGGAVKNVLAIAAGASDGLGFGDNARAALITRGLAECGRLSSALGGKRETLMGLAGLGDLVLTCTGDLSRTRRVGLALARGMALPEILAELGHVAEGVFATGAVRALAQWHGVDMPICGAVYRVLHESVPPRDAVLALLARAPRAE